MRRQVYCKECASLLLLKKGNLLPLCVAKADYQNTPLRKKASVRGIVPAGTFNMDNECPYFHRWVSLKEIQLKKWIRKDLDAKQAKFKEFSAESEFDFNKKIRDKTKEASAEKEDSSTTVEAGIRESDFPDEETIDTSETIRSELGSDSVGEVGEGSSAEAEGNITGKGDGSIGAGI